MTAAASADARVQLHDGAVRSASLQTTDGRWVRIHSGRDPVREAEQLVESALGALPGGLPPAVMVIGPGLGYTLDAIARRAPDATVVAIEPFPALAREIVASPDRRHRIEAGRLVVLAGPDYNGSTEAGRRLGAAASHTVTFEHPVLAREFAPETAAARAAAARILTGARLNDAARQAFAGRYLLNTLRNLPPLLEEGDAARLSGAFPGVPAIVIAAGPSLDAALPRLRALQDHALLIAVDTALRPLRHAGVRPHLVMAVDPSELNARHLLGLDDTQGTWLVAEGSLDPRVLPQFGGRVFAYKVSDHQPWPWLRALGADRGTLRAWGSVLTTAFDLACVAGCSPITFAGADLSYTGGVHYCRGTMNEDAASEQWSTDERVRQFSAFSASSRRPTCEAVDLHGAAVTSTPQFVQFRDWIVARAAEARVRVINATGAGILHGGTVEQGELPKPAAIVGVDDVRATLAAAWRTSAQANQDARARVSRAIAADRLPLSDWLAFAAGRVTGEQVREVLDQGWRSLTQVTIAPAEVTRTPGSLVRIEASGAGAAVWRWETSADDGVTWVEVAGASTATLAHRVTHDARLLVRVSAANAMGTTTSPPAVVSALPAAAASDFDQDGRPDLLWRHHPTGECVVWLLDGLQLRDVGRLADRQPDPAWSIVATADVNGDGCTDIIWRHAPSGRLHAWLMRGVERIGERAAGSEPDPDWRVAGAADFDGDGQPDLLWRHVVTGALRVWLMDGCSVREARGIDAGTPFAGDANWFVAAVGDLDGDGRPDLVWRHARSGELCIVRLDNLQPRDLAALPAEPDPLWELAAALDLRGTGSADLLWRHAARGDNRIWFMDRMRHASTGSFAQDNLRCTTTDWSIAPPPAMRPPVTGADWG